MQRYLLVTLVLILVTVVTTAYAWQSPQQAPSQIARLRYAKPSTTVAVNVEEPELIAEPASLEISLSPESNRIADTSVGLLEPLSRGELPEQYDRYEPSVDLSEATQLGEISFSSDITEEYEAVDPNQRFGKGFFTLYATFAYEEMDDGMTWSWVWRRNGEIIDGGNQIWAYGDEGPGYVYLRPEEGFDLGEYSLEIWVNSELMAQSDFQVIDSISASN